MNRTTVVIPTYNRSAPVKRAIESVLDQTHDALEIFVCDDGSTDETAEVVVTFGSRVRYLQVAHSGLPAVVRNAGLQLASGEYVAFLDSDDRWLPEKLARQTAILDARREVGLVCSNAIIMGDNEDEGRAYLRDDQGASGWVLEPLLHDNFIIASTVVARRELVEDADAFSEIPLLRGLEDYDLWLRVAAAREIFYLPEPLAVYREHGGSIRSEQALSTHWRGRLLVLERLKQVLRDSNEANLPEEHLLSQLAGVYRKRLRRAYWDEGRYLSAARCLAFAAS